MAGVGESLSKLDIEKMVADAIARTVPMAISQAMAARGTGLAGTIPMVSDQATGLATHPLILHQQPSLGEKDSMPQKARLTSLKSCWS